MHIYNIYTRAYLWLYTRVVTEKFIGCHHISCWWLFWLIGSKHCNTSARSLWNTSGTMLKNKPVLVRVFDARIRGAFNKFSDFFVQIFKTVVDSWKFCMLLLYILGDDRPVFKISGSNEQLQQQLEYTLPKSDCHSWSISKRQSGR